MAARCSGWIATGLTYFFEYETFKVVHIRSVKLGALNRFLQTLILGFVIGPCLLSIVQSVYCMISHQGYQRVDFPVSSVTTKVKGIGYANMSFGPRIFDVPDYVVPSQMKDSFFVMTNAVVTSGQKQTVCPEDPEVSGVICTDDPKVCQQGVYDMLGNGVQTGKCVPSDQRANTSVCEIHAWCPVENDKSPTTTFMIPEAENFTVLIKNSITFPSFGVRRRNIIDTQNASFLRMCEYQANDPLYKLCPVFRLGTIIQQAGIKFEEIAGNGTVVSISIIWNCDLDYSVEKCIPSYEFFRLDEPNAKIAPGYNFRFANYWVDQNGSETRTTYKAYGILFIVQVQGKGGKFDPIPLATNLGSGLALLAVVSVICDIMLLYCVKMKDFYRRKKYLVVTGDDAFSPQLFSDNEAPAENINQRPNSILESDDGDISQTGDEIKILPTVKRTKRQAEAETTDQRNASASAGSSSNGTL